MKINRFEDLDCWKQAMRLIKIMIPAFFLFFCFSAFAAELDIPGSLIAKRTLYLAPQPAAAAPTCDASCAGKVYFDDDSSTVKYCDGSEWEDFGAGGAGGERYVATRIVAARDSLDTECNGSSCTNPRADHTCTGTQTTGGDEATIQLAINDVNSAGGGAVYLLEGNYWVTNPIRVHSNVAIIGTGAGTVVSAKDNAPLNGAVALDGNGIIENFDRTNGNSYILIKNLRVDGNKANNPGAFDRYCIYFKMVTHSKITNVWVENMGGTGSIRCPAIYLKESSNNIISGNNVQENDSTGIELRPSSNNNIFSGNNVQSNGTGFWIGNLSNNNIISANNMQNNSAEGIHVLNSSNCTISGNNVQSNGGDGIGLTLSTNNTISGNNVQSNNWGATNISSIYINESDNNTISGNNVHLNKKHGINISESFNNVISGNVVFDNGSTEAYDGIRVSYDSDNNLLSSNLIFDSDGGGYGINVFLLNPADICDNNYLVGNQIIPWTGWQGAINDEGTNTTYTQKEKITIEGKEVAVSNGDILEVTTSPKGYVIFDTIKAITLDATTAISDGKANGDMLILQGPSTAKGEVTINNGANVRLGGTTRALAKYDTLTLIWNGTDWLEINFSNN